MFGPTDDAFSKLPKPLVDFLLKNVTALGEILKYHVASGNFQSTELKNDMLVPSLEGKNIRINIYKDGKVSISITFDKIQLINLYLLAQ